MIGGLRREAHDTAKGKNLNRSEHSGALCRYVAVDHLKQKVSELSRLLDEQANAHAVAHGETSTTLVQGERSQMVLLNEAEFAQRFCWARRGKNVGVLLSVNSQGGQGPEGLKFPNGFELEDEAQLLRIAQVLQGFCDERLETPRTGDQGEKIH